MKLWKHLLRTFHVLRMERHKEFTRCGCSHSPSQHHIPRPDPAAIRDFNLQVEITKLQVT